MYTVATWDLLSDKRKDTFGGIRAPAVTGQDRADYATPAEAPQPRPFRPPSPKFARKALLSGRFWLILIFREGHIERLVAVDGRGATR